MLAVLPDAHFAREEFAPAAHAPPSPETGRVLRYEWRGALRKQRGEVDRMITYADHYVPLATTLVEHPPA